ncbi:barstar family protein [Aureimonas sp. ME7]|uniref:barstar family protein n=1 Tax=Aureimonas sp. ME7 TaxID=2744252 RepID=UPI0015F4CBBC|nr:barstar family protein [Aureimonas sp. ME7]
MNTVFVTIPTGLISDWASFHEVFDHALGFPWFYGANMDAWIDCMSCADQPSAEMLIKAVQPGELLALRIDDVEDFARRCPDQFKALLDGTAVVNHRRIAAGEQPVLALLISGHLP